MDLQRAGLPELKKKAAEGMVYIGRLAAGQSYIIGLGCLHKGAVGATVKVAVAKAGTHTTGYTGFSKKYRQKGKKPLISPATMSTDPKQLTYSGLEALDGIAREILSYAADQRVWAFDGEMAAGKTTLIQVLCRLLGVEETVNSPTYPLINEYHTQDGTPIYHFDFYRINKLEEALNVGVREYMDSGHFCFIEWPSQVTNILPANTFRVRLELEKDQVRKVLLYKITPPDYPKPEPRYPLQKKSTVSLI